MTEEVQSPERQATLKMLSMALEPVTMTPLQEHLMKNDRALIENIANDPPW